MEKPENKAAYRSIMKGTAVFGGVQVFTILINVIRGKLVAIFLGPVGMGITALLNSTVTTIQQLSGLGLNFSAVKDISQIAEKEEVERVASIVSVTRRLVFLSAILGALLTGCFSSLLSRFAFGNTDYTLSFLLLSAMVFFTTLTLGETAILQGLRQLKQLAVSTIVGALVGLVIGTPLYYFFGTQGIVPAMILLAVSTYVANRLFTWRLGLPKVSTTYHDVTRQGRQMIALGVISMLAALLGSFTLTLFNAYIRHASGGEVDVGLIQAATSISNQYVGLVFTAMAVDYFPRLAAICDDQSKLQQTVTQQLEVVMLIVSPLLVGLLVTTPLVVRVLLSSEFMPTIPLLRWIGFGIFFKAMSFPLGYIAFAKGDKKTFFWFEGIYGNALTLLCNVVGYSVAGIEGVGVSYVIVYVLYLISVGALACIKYHYRVNVAVLKSMIPLFLMTFVSFGLMMLTEGEWWAYLLSGILFVVSCVYSFRALDKKIGIKELVRTRFARNR